MRRHARRLVSPRPRLRRLVWRAAGSLALGLALAVGLAVGPAMGLVEPVEGGILYCRAQIRPLWEARDVDRRFLAARGVSFVGLGTHEMVLHGFRPGVNGVAETAAVHIVEGGFPLPCLRGEVWRFGGREDVRSGLANPFGPPDEPYRSGRTTSVLPVDPLWAGMVVNVGLAAVMMWLGLSAVARRRYRGDPSEADHLLPGESGERCGDLRVAGIRGAGCASDAEPGRRGPV